MSDSKHTKKSVTIKVPTARVTTRALPAKIIAKPSGKELKDEYDRMYPYYEQLINRIEEILHRDLSSHKIKYHDVNKRVKNFKSFSSKIKRTKCRRPFNEIDDICGARVVCLYRSDLNKINNMITNRFLVTKADLKTKDMAKDQFGYESNHYIVKLKTSADSSKYKSIKCEIQVRTILMDAWASVSHHMDYKTEHDIPEVFKRDFYALSGLFHIADSHFQFIKDEREKSIRRRRELTKKLGFDMIQDLNLDSLKAYVTWKWPDRKRVYDTESWSEMLTDLAYLGYSTLKKIDRVVNRGYKGFELYEETKHDTGYFFELGVLRLSVVFANKKYRRMVFPRETDLDSYRELAKQSTD